MKTIIVTFLASCCCFLLLTENNSCLAFVTYLQRQKKLCAAQHEAATTSSWTSAKKIKHCDTTTRAADLRFASTTIGTATRRPLTVKNWMLHAESLNDNDGGNENDDNNLRPILFRAMGRRVKHVLQPLSRRFIDELATVGYSIRRRRRLLAFAIAISGTTGGAFSGWLLPLQAAHAASAPVMALPKAESRDPASEALMERDRRLVQEEQDELTDFARRGREIEATQGESARVKFEMEYQAQKQVQAQERIQGLERLKRELLDQGLDPFTDMEAQRQVILYEKNVDLGNVPGTRFNLEREYEKKGSPKSEKVKKAPHRAVIACMVQDLKNRGIDPLEYFEKRQEQTYDIMDMKPQKAVALLQEYRTNLEEYGQITIPKEGEISVKDKMEAAAKAAQDPKVAKAEAQRVKALAAAEKKAEKQRLAEQAKALNEQEKQTKLAAKHAEKQAKLEAKKAAELAGKQAEKEARLATAAALRAAADTVLPIEDTSVELDAASADSLTIEEQDSLLSIDEDTTTVAVPSSSTSVEKKTESKINIVKAASVVVAAGGGAYALQIYRNKKAADEAERQRQFKLLMDGASPKSAPALLEDEMDTTTTTTTTTPSKAVSSPAATTTPAPAPAAPAAAPKKRLGFFGKKKNTRETDLSVLVSGDSATAPAFASLLAQILTYGAPGRFPSVVDMLGGIEKMPMDEFDLDLAKQLLVEGTTKAGLAPSEYAEIFANVVNCMLIDIVDLASTSLKEKQDSQKLTVDAINIVVEFMNHAASLYDAVAGGVAITPVTYGGTLSKSKLEQMYSAYAVSGMSNMENMPGDFDSRVGLLADVFDINSKKAEGLMMKALQKNMMEMMKSGEGMEELMKSMGGMEGLMGEGGGMGGAGDETDPEQLKAMLTELKRAKDSGEISNKDLTMVKDMFKDSFGMSMDDLMKSDDISGTDKEVLDLMKDVLYN